MKQKGGNVLKCVNAAWIDLFGGWFFTHSGDNLLKGPSYVVKFLPTTRLGQFFV